MEDGIGKKIREARERAGLTQEDLAERMEVSRQAVSKWEADLSRPSSENLLRLCRMLGLDWEDLAGETPAVPPEEEVTALEEESPAQAEVRRRKGGKWIVLLPVLLLSLLSVGEVLVMSGVLGHNNRTPGDPDVPPPSENGEADPTAFPEERPFPEFIELAAKENRSFGSSPNADRTVPAREVEDGLLYQHWFPGTDVCLYFYQSWISEYDGDPYYVLSAAYTESPGGLDDQEEVPLVATIDEGTDIAMPYFQDFQALGHSGCKAVTYDEFGPVTFFFSLDQDGIPQLLFIVDSETHEIDIDADGENEILSPESQYILYDRGMDDYWAYKPEIPEGFSLEFTYSQEDDGTIPPTPAFCLKSEDKRWKSYRHLWADRLVPGEVACSKNAMNELLCPDVTDAVITFRPGELDWMDYSDPDLPFQDPGAGYPTHRQLAYMALQTIYDLTGVKLERCYAEGTEYGVWLSVERTTNFGDFCSFDRDVRWQEYENSIGGFYLTWKGEYTEYSPLEAPEIPGETEAEQCLWLYEHARFCQAGRITEVGWDICTRLFLEDGSFFEASAGDGGVELRGIYPPGFSH